MTRITEVGPRLGQRTGEHTRDAGGLLVLPGCVRRAYPHAAADGRGAGSLLPGQRGGSPFGGTTTFLAFNNPGHGVSKSGELAPRCWPFGQSSRARTDGEGAVDSPCSSVISGKQEDLAAGANRNGHDHPQGVHGLRLPPVPDERLFAALRVMGRHSSMLQVHCQNATENDALVSRGAGSGDGVECRRHAACRPTYAEAEATHRAMAPAQAADASVYVVHLSCADALAEVVAATARGWPVYAETCPHYPVADRCGLRG